MHVAKTWTVRKEIARWMPDRNGWVPLEIEAKCNGWKEIGGCQIEVKHNG